MGTSNKRHRRTKAELLQDPAYRKKHGLDAPKITDLSKVSAVKKPRKDSTTGKKDKVKSLELEYLPKMYRAWEKVQSLMNELDCELNLRVQPKELMHFDFACSRMEQAFEKLEDEIKAGQQ